VRLVVDVRISVPAPSTAVADLVRDPASWPAMPGATLTLRVEPGASPREYRYRIVSGLPVREHRGTVELVDTDTGGTEIVLVESFRPRIWGTGGYLRGRRERAMIDAARQWGQGAAGQAAQSDQDRTT